MPSPAPPHSLLTHLTCSGCAARAEPTVFGPCPSCGAPLLCRYDLSRLDLPMPPTPGRQGCRGVFAWAPLLPVLEPERRVSLGEGDTPVLELRNLAQELGLATLHVKDESGNPTGSFKARGLAVAVAAHAERGATAITLPTAGNAGSAAAVYARRHGLACRVALPAAASPTYRAEQRLAGARVIAVTGDLGACGDWVRSHAGPATDHVVATFFEPFRVEGKKTMAYELWARFGEDLPDVIVYPTGGGTGLVAMEKAFDELRAAGLLRRPTPRLIVAQVEGCAPVVRALEEGADAVEPWDASRRTLAEGLRVPRLPGGRLVLAAVRATGGCAVAVTESDLLAALRRAARTDGFLACAEGAAALAAVVALRARGELEAARVLAFNTASIYKSPETLAAAATG